MRRACALLGGVFLVFAISAMFAPVAAETSYGPAGVGGFDVWWRVKGHFDDPRAATCRPDPAGLIIDGKVYVWSDEDDHDFCRNHMFVDSLEWIRLTPASVGSASAAATVAAQPVSEPAAATPGPGPAILVVLGAVVVGLTLGAAITRRRRSARP